MIRPPQAIRSCLEIVYALLHVEKANESIRSLRGEATLSFEWPLVLKMLTRFETFFPAMQNYDLSPLMRTPAVAQHITALYFDESKEERLTEERVRKCSVAAAGLFRWSAQTAARVIAALELHALQVELAQMSPQHEQAEHQDTADLSCLQNLPQMPSQQEFPETPGLELETDLCHLCKVSAYVRELPRTHILWHHELSDTELCLSDDSRTVSSSSDVLMKTAFSASILPSHEPCSIALVYNHGTQVYLVAGICQEGCAQAWDEQGSFRNRWENGRHRGCWMYSFFYNSLSEDGSDWRDKPAANETKIESGDELVMEFGRSPGTLWFFHKRKGHTCKMVLGSFTGLTATYRVVLLLGQCNQSVSIG